MSFSNVTPFKASQIANAILAGRDDARRTTPQQMYGYARKQQIVSNHKEFVEAGGKGNAKQIKVMLDGESFKTWLDAYIAGKIVTTSSLDELVAEFSV
jgi:hypothetical protein